MYFQCSTYELISDLVPDNSTNQPLPWDALVVLKRLLEEARINRDRESLRVVSRSWEKSYQIRVEELCQHTAE